MFCPGVMSLISIRICPVMFGYVPGRTDFFISPMMKSYIIQMEEQTKHTVFLLTQCGIAVKIIREICGSQLSMG